MSIFKKNCGHIQEDKCRVDNIEFVYKDELHTYPKPSCSLCERLKNEDMCMNMIEDECHRLENPYTMICGHRICKDCIFSINNNGEYEVRDDLLFTLPFIGRNGKREIHSVVICSICRQFDLGIYRNRGDRNRIILLNHLMYKRSPLIIALSETLRSEDGGPSSLFNQYINLEFFSFSERDRRKLIESNSTRIYICEPLEESGDRVNNYQYIGRIFTYSLLILSIGMGLIIPLHFLGILIILGGIIGCYSIRNRYLFSLVMGVSITYLFRLFYYFK